jgi:hypothetical protein
MNFFRVTGVGVVSAAVALSALWRFGWADAPSDEEFQPIVEAEQPEGFPGYTPVGRIEVKRYPAYRLARAEGGGSFWTLFRHIKRNKIAMTAPVQLDYAPTDGQQPREKSMAFLYGSPDLGNPGQAGNVSVVDLPPSTVVSIGVRGARTDQKVRAAQLQLREWVESQRQFVTDGDLRVMAHNSPFVPRDRQYFEVQIPIRKI